MTLLQIQYALECANTGSITKAAENMYTTSSNMSKMIKALEKELGFDLFIRSSNGVELTMEGNNFINHAHRITNEIEHMKQYKKKKSINEFTLACQYNPYCIAAFNKLIRYVMSMNKEYNLAIYSYSDTDCMELLKKQTCDAAVTVIPKKHTKEYINLIHYNGLEAEKLLELPVCVTLRKGHPLLRYLKSDESFDFSLLADFPFVMLSITGVFNAPFRDSNDPLYGIISKSKSLQVNDHHWRDEIIDNTDAFGVGFAAPKSMLERNNRVAIQIPGSYAAVYMLSLAETEKSEEVKRFHDYLAKALNDFAAFN